MMSEESLNKTWFIDIDGTIVKHMYNEDIDFAIDSLGEESHTLEIPLEKSVRFLNELPKEDTVVLTTARDGKHKEHTERMLKYLGVRYDRIMFDLRAGPRYLINDIKPVGTAGNAAPINTAYSLNVKRDEGIECLAFSVPA